MDRKLKKIMVNVLCLAMMLGFSITIQAAEHSENNQAVEIELFDLESPYLIEIREGTELTRTTSRPTSVWNLATQGAYSYSAYSNNNIMWSKYIFFDPSNIGAFSITAKSTNTNYRMIFYDVRNSKQYVYSVPSTNIIWRTENFNGWNNADEFYFGVDTAATGGAVSVNGVVNY